MYFNNIFRTAFCIKNRKLKGNKNNTNKKEIKIEWKKGKKNYKDEEKKIFFLNE